MKGTKRKFVIDWPEVPEIWPVLTRTNLDREETLLLQHVGFHLQERPTLLPRRRHFQMSNIFKTVTYDHPTPTNVDANPTVRNNRVIRRNSNAPTTEEQNI